MRHSYLGVTEAQLTIIILLLATAAVGPAFWRDTLVAGVELRAVLWGLAFAGALWQSLDR
jgi:hypothetical protein